MSEFPNDAESAALRAAACGLHLDGKVSEAVAAYRCYLDQFPDDHRIWCNLGAGLRALGRLPEAVDCYRRALALEEDKADYWSNLGNALSDLDETAGSLEAHRRAVDLAPDNPALLHNLGLALDEGVRCVAALEAFDRCLAIDPNRARAQWDRALTLLRLGRFAEGWPAYEWRWRIGEYQAPSYDAAPWQGEALAGKTLLLYCEQGLGDTIWASRFIPALKGLGATVILECHPRLTRLFSALPGVDRLVPPGSLRAGFDHHCSLMSLPGRLEVSPDNPAPPSRLTIPGAARRKAADALATARSPFKVGIVWSGSATYRHNAKRTIAAKRFLPLARIPGVQLYSLYKGPLEHELRDPEVGASVIDLASTDEDLADAAAAVAALDLVITTDTAIAHLAGTLGRPVWTLLTLSPLWLYGTEGEATPWYPSMRLYRQHAPGNWDGVFDRLTRDLATLPRVARAEGAAKRNGRPTEDPPRG